MPSASDPPIRKSKRRELLLTIAPGRAAVSPGELGAGELVTARDEFDFAAAAGPASTQDPPAAMSSTRPSISVMEPPRSVSGARYSHPSGAIQTRRGFLATLPTAAASDRGPGPRRGPPAHTAYYRGA